MKRIVSACPHGYSRQGRLQGIKNGVRMLNFAARHRYAPLSSEIMSAGAS